MQAYNFRLFSSMRSQLNICFQDSKLVVTGSADKSVKVWGLDFGDCHKSLHAHDDM